MPKEAAGEGVCDVQFAPYEPLQKRRKGGGREEERRRKEEERRRKEHRM